jgi:hypothetical protein
VDPRDWWCTFPVPISICFSSWILAGDISGTSARTLVLSEHLCPEQSACCCRAMSRWCFGPWWQCSRTRYPVEPNTVSLRNNSVSVENLSLVPFIFVLECVGTTGIIHLYFGCSILCQMCWAYLILLAYFLTAWDYHLKLNLGRAVRAHIWRK